MLSNLWTELLYQPLFNALIWIYNNWTEMNLGWAVVYLTVFLRIALLPFTIIDERDKAKNEALVEDLRRVEKGYKNDPVQRKEEVRKILKKRKVRPWAKATVLGVQLLVLVLLYQVFIAGITGERVARTLYPTVDHPGVIRTEFYGFDLGARHDWAWAGIVALWLMAEVYIGLRKRKTEFTKTDLTYFLLFPAAVFFALWWLPMVKSLFILTSMLFSVIVGGFLGLLFKPRKAKA